MSGQIQFWIQVNSLSVKMLEKPKSICVTLPLWDSEGFEIQLFCYNRFSSFFPSNSHWFKPEKIWSKVKRMSHSEVSMLLPDLSSKKGLKFLLNILRVANHLTLMLRQNKRENVWMLFYFIFFLVYKYTCMSKNLTACLKEACQMFIALILKCAFRLHKNSKIIQTYVYISKSGGTL